MIPVIHDQMLSFLTKVASRFLPVSAIKAASGDFLSLKYKEKEDQNPGTV